MQEVIEAKFSIGNIVKHRFLNFRGVIFDLDPKFNNINGLKLIFLLNFE